jgi:trans-2,3-dihydro-3-hydroxyanthranilate isomerase
MDLTYTHLDVFTREPFGGNQLAVFLDPPPGLPGSTMQAIANEMAFSESTFVFAPDRPGTDVRVRIFTPAEELPMAGHPTIGTAFALAAADRVRAPQAEVVFGEGIGPVPVALMWKDQTLGFAWMTQPRPVFAPDPYDTQLVAHALGLDEGDLEPDGLRSEQVSCGVPFVIVPVASRAAVDRAVCSLAALRRACGDLPVYLFTRETASDGAAVYTRMFAPNVGIAEDPATGSASGPLGAYLVRHGVWPGAPGSTIVNLQGRKMGRPSWLHIAPVVANGEVAAVRVGGESVIVGHGAIHLP